MLKYTNAIFYKLNKFIKHQSRFYNLKRYKKVLVNKMFSQERVASALHWNGPFWSASIFQRSTLLTNILLSSEAVKAGHDKFLPMMAILDQNKDSTTRPDQWFIF